MLFEVGEFETSLKKLCSGDLGLVDSLNAMQLAMQATVSQVKSDWIENIEKNYNFSSVEIVDSSQNCPVQVLCVHSYVENATLSAFNC